MKVRYSVACRFLTLSVILRNMKTYSCALSITCLLFPKPAVNSAFYPIYTDSFCIPLIFVYVHTFLQLRILLGIFCH